MVKKTQITEIFDIILKKYDTSVKCHTYESFTYTTIDGKEVSIDVETLHQRPAFQRAVQEVVDDYIKKGLESKIWRVDVPDLDWIKGAKMYRTKNGSTIAIRPDGDIVAVTGKLGENGYSMDNSEALLAFAVANGGTKLDSFDGNWRFYLKCGFEAKSWISFNEEYHPPLWQKGRDKHEPVIFMSYTGNRVKVPQNETESNKGLFYTSVNETRMSDANPNNPNEETPWDVAYRVRDDRM
jgi:hypothetical protein